MIERERPAQFEVEWVIPGRVCEVHVPLYVDEGRARAYDAMMVKLLDEAQHPVHVIVEQPQAAVTVPVAVWTAAAHVRHRHLGEVLVIGLDKAPVIHFIASLVARVMSVTILSFKTRADVMAHLAAKGLTMGSETASNEP